MGENYFIATHEGETRKRYFPSEVTDRLKITGTVEFNPLNREITEDELCRLAPDATVLLTHWGTPQITKQYLSANPNLKLIAHCAGTVANIASEDTFRAGIKCISANGVMAKYTAEAVLGLLISALRGFKENDIILQKGVWTKNLPSASLLDCTVGLIGLGAVGRNLLDLLAPFGTRVLVYDPYIPREALRRWKNVRFGDFDEVLGADAVSLHASKTKETYHIINEAAFSKMKDGAVFINTSRGWLVDTQAAAKMIPIKGLRCAFDVYEQEECPQDALANLDGVILQPHIAALPAGVSMTQAIIDDILRWNKGEKLQLSVEYEQFLHMTKE